MALQQAGNLLYPAFTQQQGRDPERDTARSERGWMDGWVLQTAGGAVSSKPLKQRLSFIQLYIYIYK